MLPYSSRTTYHLKNENNTKFVCGNLPFDDIKISKRKRMEYKEELQTFAEYFRVFSVSRVKVIQFNSLPLTC